MSMPEITYVAFGQDQEISIEARFKNNEEMREFLGRTLPFIPGVTVSRYAFVPRILRNIDEWIPPKEDFEINSASTAPRRGGFHFFSGLQLSDVGNHDIHHFYSHQETCILKT